MLPLFLSKERKTKRGRRRGKEWSGIWHHIHAGMKRRRKEKWLKQRKEARRGKRGKRKQGRCREMESARSSKEEPHTENKGTKHHNQFGNIESKERKGRQNNESLPCQNKFQHEESSKWKENNKKYSNGKKCGLCSIRAACARLDIPGPTIRSSRKEKRKKKKEEEEERKQQKMDCQLNRRLSSDCICHASSLDSAFIWLLLVSFIFWSPIHDLCTLFWALLILSLVSIINCSLLLPKKNKGRERAWERWETRRTTKWRRRRRRRKGRKNDDAKKRELRKNVIEQLKLRAIKNQGKDFVAQTVSRKEEELKNGDQTNRSCSVWHFLTGWDRMLCFLRFRLFLLILPFPSLSFLQSLSLVPYIESDVCGGSDRTNFEQSTHFITATRRLVGLENGHDWTRIALWELWRWQKRMSRTFRPHWISETLLSLWIDAFCRQISSISLLCMFSIAGSPRSCLIPFFHSLPCWFPFFGKRRTNSFLVRLSLPFPVFSGLLLSIFIFLLLFACFACVFSSSPQPGPGKTCDKCHQIQPSYRREASLKIIQTFPENANLPESQVDRRRELPPEEARAIFLRMTSSDVIEIGKTFNPHYDLEQSRPEWWILTLLPCPPPAVRPSVSMDGNSRSNDDLTHKLLDIVKANRALKTRVRRRRSRWMNQDIPQMSRLFCPSASSFPYLPFCVFLCSFLLSFPLNLLVLYHRSPVL